MDEPHSFIFAPEIEQALVASAFQVPERIALIYRELDPALHITQPHLRYILDAIRLAYTELGSTDFASVIGVLREEGNLAECGGLEGVNSVLDQYRYGFSSPEAAEQIITHYIEMLKAYAVARSNDPPVPVYRFMRGDITLIKNQTRSEPGMPEWIGEGTVAGRLYRASAFASTNKNGQSILSVSLRPKMITP